MVEVDRQRVDRRDAVGQRDVQHRPVARLRFRQRLARAAQQRRRIVARLALRHAKAAPEHGARIRHHKWPREGGVQRGDRRRHRRPGRLDHQHELRPTKPRDHRIHPDRLARDRLRAQHGRLDQAVDRGTAMCRIDDIEPRQSDQHHRHRPFLGDAPDDPAPRFAGFPVILRGPRYAPPIDRAARRARRMAPREAQRLDEFAFARRAGQELCRAGIEEFADRLDIAARHQDQQCGTVGGDEPAEPARRRQSVVERTARIDQCDCGTACQKPAFQPVGVARDRRLPSRTSSGARQDLGDLVTLKER